MSVSKDVLSRVVCESMEDCFRHGVGTAINVVEAAADAVTDIAAGEILRAVANQLRLVSAQFTLTDGEP